jgi:hypothetical protein
MDQKTFWTNERIMQLDEFKRMYIEYNLVTIYDEEAFAKACMVVFEQLGQNPTYEEFEELMEALPHTVMS